MSDNSWWFFFHAGMIQYRSFTFFLHGSRSSLMATNFQSVQFKSSKFSTYHDGNTFQYEKMGVSKISKPPNLFFWNGGFPTFPTRTIQLFSCLECCFTSFWNNSHLHEMTKERDVGYYRLFGAGGSPYSVKAGQTGSIISSQVMALPYLGGLF